MREHSRVGLITNSSTAVYTTADVNAPMAYEQFINKILELAGSDLKASDIVEITRERDIDPDYAVDYLVDEASDIEPNTGIGKFLSAEEIKELKGDGHTYDVAWKIVNRLMKDPHARKHLPVNEEADPFLVRVCSKKDGTDIECIMAHIEGEEYPC